MESSGEFYVINLAAPSVGLTAAQYLILHACKIGALRVYVEGKTTKLGRLSPHFWNSGDFSTAEDMYYLSNAYAAALQQHYHEWRNLNVLFGPAYKGILLVGAVGERLRLLGVNMGITHDRKEAKDHGEGGTLVGANMMDANVAIIDDVISGGTAKKHAMNLITQAGGRPKVCLIGFDRQERGEKTMFSGAQEFTKETGLQVIAAANLDDFIHVLTVCQDIDNGKPLLWLRDKVLAYRDQYGTAL